MKCPNFIFMKNHNTLQVISTTPNPNKQGLKGVTCSTMKVRLYYFNVCLIGIVLFVCFYAFSPSNLGLGPKLQCFLNVKEDLD